MAIVPEILNQKSNTGLIAEYLEIPKYVSLFLDCLGILQHILLFITEGKYWNQLMKFRKFRDVLSSGSHETGGTAKKVLHLIQPSQNPI